MDQTDEVLMLECAKGGKEALELLYQRYKKRIFNFAYRMLNNRADAEEVTGDFFAVISAKPNYSVSARFVTWAYTIVKNLCLTRQRSKVRVASNEIEVADSGLNQADVLAEDDMANIVRRAVGQLSEEYRTAIILREYEKLSYLEIAAVMQCSVEQVKINIFRAREKLRVILAPLVKEADNV